MNLVCFCFFFVLKFSPMCRFHNKGNAFPFSIMLSEISFFSHLRCECFKLSLQVRNDYDEKVPLVY